MACRRPRKMCGTNVIAREWRRRKHGGSLTPAMHPAALTADQLLKQIEEVHTRRSGPGGQHRNKTQTAVVLFHQPTGLSAEASERRSQAENRAVALRRLRMRLALEHRGRPQPGPSELWQSRVRGRRLSVAAGHEDYPALVAEALDHLQACGLDMRQAADILGVTATQLLGLFRKDTAAWTHLLRRRKELSLPALQ